jgi:hypothetical protein
MLSCGLSKVTNCRDEWQESDLQRLKPAIAFCQLKPSAERPLLSLTERKQIGGSPPIADLQTDPSTRPT